MLRNFLKNKKAQNTAEYALLIALVIAGVIAMQTYVQRALQARSHDAANYMATTATTTGMGTNSQYEPYYLSSNYDVTSNEFNNKRLGAGLVAADSENNRLRTGSENETYDKTDMTKQ